MEILSQNSKKRREGVGKGRKGREKKARIFISRFVFKTLFMVGQRLEGGGES